MNENIQEVIKKSEKILMEYWPLTSFIAVNPLWNSVDQSFFDAVSTPWFDGLMDLNFYYMQYQSQNTTLEHVREAILKISNINLKDNEVKDWINSSLKETHQFKNEILFSYQIEEYQFQQPRVWIRERIFKILRDYFGRKKFENCSLIQYWDQNNEIIDLEFRPVESNELYDSIFSLVEALGIPQDVLGDYFKNIYFEIYGWSSLMLWRNNHPNNPWLPGSDSCAVVLLMWLTYEYVISKVKNKRWKKTYSQSDVLKLKQRIKNRYIWHTAYEQGYYKKFDSLLNSGLKKSDREPDAQFIFCIDTRSEGIRRHIESQGNYETFGIAGFFGAIFKLKCDKAISYQSPALIEPTSEIQAVKCKSKFKKFCEQVSDVVKNVKKQLISPFAFFEVVGLWFSLFMLFKTVQPKFMSKKKSTVLKLKNTLTVEEQFSAAQILLNSIGLVDGFSKFVIVCGHQSNHLNNPFKSSLNCGACGGNSGASNAMLICDILNRPDIRRKLKAVNIHIPDETKFLPVCHHTVYDRLELLKGKLPKKINTAMSEAATALREEESRACENSNKLSEKENKWSELIPEWGLVNNAAMVIGPRELTAGKNLNRRVFLHSYDPDVDNDGAVLQNILSGPGVVAHWINAQYYFSTVNPGLFGAGNKAIHNVIEDIGVLEGNLSDLKIGLPIQSTYFQSKPVHEPRRITIVIYAYKHIIDKALINSPDFKKLVDNEWVLLKCFAPRA
ncbi:MAG: putative inorganic carbon transporter subunit DabA [Gammaproteobacteria bacterium]